MTRDEVKVSTDEGISGEQQEQEQARRKVKDGKRRLIWWWSRMAGSGLKVAPRLLAGNSTGRLATEFKFERRGL